MSHQQDIQPGDCVKIPDGRIARVRDSSAGLYRVRVKRQTRNTHQVVNFPGKDLEKVACPKGWMSPAGYNRYLKVTLEKMRLRESKKS